MTRISLIFGLNCSDISGRQLNPWKTLSENLKEVITLICG